jgi:hypothetical protein
VTCIRSWAWVFLSLVSTVRATEEAGSLLTVQRSLSSSSYTLEVFEGSPPADRLSGPLVFTKSRVLGSKKIKTVRALRETLSKYENVISESVPAKSKAVVMRAVTGDGDPVTLRLHHYSFDEVKGAFYELTKDIPYMDNFWRAAAVIDPFVDLYRLFTDSEAQKKFGAQIALLEMMALYEFISPRDRLLARYAVASSVKTAEKVADFSDPYGQTQAWMIAAPVGAGAFKLGRSAVLDLVAVTKESKIAFLIPQTMASPAAFGPSGAVVQIAFPKEGSVLILEHRALPTYTWKRPPSQIGRLYIPDAIQNPKIYHPLSKEVLLKLKYRHKVDPSEVAQAVRNRERIGSPVQLGKNFREKLFRKGKKNGKIGYKGKYWFESKTDAGRTLIVEFDARRTDSKITIRSTYEPDPELN